MAPFAAGNGLHSRAPLRGVEEIESLLTLFHCQRGSQEGTALHTALQGFVQGCFCYFRGASHTLHEVRILFEIGAPQIAESPFHVVQAPESVQGDFELAQVVDLGEQLPEEGSWDTSELDFALRKPFESSHHLLQPNNLPDYLIYLPGGGVFKFSQVA